MNLREIHLNDLEWPHYTYRFIWLFIWRLDLLELPAKEKTPKSQAHALPLSYQTSKKHVVWKHVSILTFSGIWFTVSRVTNASFTSNQTIFGSKKSFVSLRCKVISQIWFSETHDGIFKSVLSKTKHAPKILWVFVNHWHIFWIFSIEFEFQKSKCVLSIKLFLQNALLRPAELTGGSHWRNFEKTRFLTIFWFS